MIAIILATLVFGFYGLAIVEPLVREHLKPALLGWLARELKEI